MRAVGWGTVITWQYLQMPSTWAYSHMAVHAWHTVTSPEVPPCGNYGVALWETD